MARLWTSGAELNSAATGVEVTTSASNVAVVTSPVRSGNFSWQFKATVAGTGIIRPDLFTTDQNTIVYTRVYIYIVSLPVGNNQPIIRVLNSANAQMGRVLFQTNGTLRIQNSSSTAIGALVPASLLPLNQWHCIEFKLDATTNPGNLELKLNGTVVASGANNIQGSWTRVQIGATSNPATYEYYMDDIAINDSTGTDNNDYPGNGKVIILRPNGTGDSDDWAIDGNAPGPAATSWQSINEVTPDEAITFVKANILGKQSMFNFDNANLDRYDFIKCIQVGVRYRNSVANPTMGFKLQLKSVSGGIVSQSDEIIPNLTAQRTNASNIITYPLTLSKTPEGNNWNSSLLNSLQAGFIMSTGGSDAIWITSLWVMVEYVPYSYSGAQLLQLLL